MHVHSHNSDNNPGGDNQKKQLQQTAQKRNKRYPYNLSADFKENYSRGANSQGELSRASTRHPWTEVKVILHEL